MCISVFSQKVLPARGRHPGINREWFSTIPDGANAPTAWHTSLCAHQEWRGQPGYGQFYRLHSVSRHEGGWLQPPPSGDDLVGYVEPITVYPNPTRFVDGEGILAEQMLGWGIAQSDIDDVLYVAQSDPAWALWWYGSRHRDQDLLLGGGKLGGRFGSDYFGESIHVLLPVTSNQGIGSRLIPATGKSSWMRGGTDSFFVRFGDAENEVYQSQWAIYWYLAAGRSQFRVICRRTEQGYVPLLVGLHAERAMTRKAISNLWKETEVTRTQGANGESGSSEHIGKLVLPCVPDTLVGALALSSHLLEGGGAWRIAAERAASNVLAAAERSAGRLKEEKALFEEALEGMARSGDALKRAEAPLRPKS